MKKQLLSRKRLTSLLYSLLMILLYINVGWGQQVIGSFTYMDGGFEGQTPTITLSSKVSTTAWTVSATSSSTTRAIISDPIVARTGNKYASHTTTASNIRLQSPSTATAGAGPAVSTSYTVQYYIKTATDPATGLNRGGIYNDATNSSMVVSTIVGGWSSNVWTKAYSTITTNATQITPYAATGFGAVRSFVAGRYLYDDFVIYPGAYDSTVPNSPNTPTVSGTTVSWSADAGGVDGGGYVVVRYASLPNADNDPNENGIYAVGNTTTNGTAALSGTVVYVGTSTSFTDGVAGAVSGSDYYKIYAVDKAFNYSTEITGTAVPAGTPLITSTPATPLTGFTYVQGSGPSSVKQTAIE